MSARKLRKGSKPGTGRENPKPIEGGCGQTLRTTVPETQMPPTDEYPLRQHHQLAGIK